MRLRNGAGELVPGRCGSTNQCDYCARLGAVENAELLALDALGGTAPAVWACLTTAQAVPDPAAFYRAREAVIRALRRRWPACEYAALVEFTTGYGERSGGLRRPHWNLLLKGIPREDAERVAEVVKSVWCSRHDVVASPDAQWVGPVSEFGGLMRYIALHFQKESQRPPDGWRGHRFLKSRGYLDVDEATIRASKAFGRRVVELVRKGHDVTGEVLADDEIEARALSGSRTAAAREQARRALRFKRELWKAERAGYPAGEVAEQVAQAAVVRAETEKWEVVCVTRQIAPATDVPVDGSNTGQLLAAVAWTLSAAGEFAAWRKAQNVPPPTPGGSLAEDGHPGRRRRCSLPYPAEGDVKEGALQSVLNSV